MAPVPGVFNNWYNHNTVKPVKLLKSTVRSVQGTTTMAPKTQSWVKIFNPTIVDLTEPAENLTELSIRHHEELTRGQAEQMWIACALGSVLIAAIVLVAVISRRWR